MPMCGSRLQSREELSVLLFDNEPLACRTDFTDAVDGPSPQRGPCRRSPLHRVRHLLDGLRPGDRGISRGAGCLFDGGHLGISDRFGLTLERLSLRREVRQHQTSRSELGVTPRPLGAAKRPLLPLSCSFPTAAMRSDHLSVMLPS